MTVLKSILPSNDERISGEVNDQKGLGSKAKRPEPEGREEPRPGSAGAGRVWKKPLGVKPQQAKVT